MTNFIFSKTLIIGLGLIGGSIAKALKNHHISEQIYAFDPDITSIEIAKKDGVINDFYLLENELKQFDLIIICAPLNQYQKIFTKLAGKISSNAIIFDIGSVKNFKFKDIPANFVGCHPIAGKESAGYKNSDANLFKDKKFIICHNNLATPRVIEIINAIGAQPLSIDASLHDKIFALVSHLPQFLSFLTSDFSLNKINPKINDDFITRAFRLNDSNPEIWQDIFKMNEKNLEFFYEKFFDNLENYIDNIHQINLTNEIKSLDHLSLTDSNINFDSNLKNILENNFGIIGFRILMILSYLKIPEIKTYQSYGGSGFKDFISAINLIKIDPSTIDNLLQKNSSSIIRYFENISN